MRLSPLESGMRALLAASCRQSPGRHRDSERLIIRLDVGPNLLQLRIDLGRI